MRAYMRLAQAEPCSAQRRVVDAWSLQNHIDDFDRCCRLPLQLPGGPKLGRLNWELNGVPLLYNYDIFLAGVRTDCLERHGF